MEAASYGPDCLVDLCTQSLSNVGPCSGHLINSERAEECSPDPGAPTASRGGQDRAPLAVTKMSGGHICRRIDVKGKFYWQSPGGSQVLQLGPAETLGYQMG